MSNPFEQSRKQFQLPEGVVYFDGNSLGPLPRAATRRLRETLEDEWGGLMIRAWNQAGWMDKPMRIGNRIGRLIGATEGSVTVGDTLSVKIYQALDGALALRPERRVVLSDRGNFPSDLYMAEGLLKIKDAGYQLKLVDPEEIESAIDDSVAALLLTQVDYRTGRLHDLPGLTALAHRFGVPVVWDLAHSAGAVPIDLAGADVDFAAGCTYKYLNGGPGSPAFIYVAPRLQGSVQPALAGWLGHAEPFAFELGYRPANGVERMRVGTPPILAMSVLEAALDIWDGISMEQVRAESIKLSEVFIKEVESGCSMLTLASPRNPVERGGQVSFRFEHSYAAIQALIQGHQVIGDFRAPDIMRFAFPPLFLSQDDVKRGARAIVQVMQNKEWDNPDFAKRAAVT